MINEIYITRQDNGMISFLYDKPTRFHDGRQIGKTEEDLFPELRLENSPGTLVLDFHKKGQSQDTDQNLYAPVCWPCVQMLFDIEGFQENSRLIDDERGIEEYGSSAYFVNTQWLDQATKPRLYIARDKDVKEEGYTVPGKVTIFLGEPRPEEDRFTGREICSPSNYYFTNLRYDDGPVLLIPEIKKLPWESEEEIFILTEFPENQKYQEFNGFDENSFLTDDGGYFIRREWMEQVILH
jgi:hypothetical protein